MVLERRDFLFKLALPAAAAVVSGLYFRPVTTYLTLMVRHPELDSASSASIDPESGRMLAEMKSIDPNAENLSISERAAVFFLMGRYLVVYDAQRSGRLSLDMNYAMPRINPDTQQVVNSQVGEAIAVVSPFSGVLEATVNWGDPGWYDRVVSQTPIDKTDGVGIMAHELLGHIHYDLVRLLELFQRGFSSLETARALNRENPKASEEEIESWCVEILAAYLYQKTHPEDQYTGFYHNPQQVGTDALGFVDFWIERQDKFPDYPWQNGEMRWFLERTGALVSLRNAAVSDNFSQPLLLPITVRDSTLDKEFLETVADFFTVDALARDYGVNMDPSEGNPWIQLHLADVSSGRRPNGRRLLQVQTNRQHTFLQKMIL